MWLKRELNGRQQEVKAEELMWAWAEKPEALWFLCSRISVSQRIEAGTWRKHAHPQPLTVCICVEVNERSYCTTVSASISSSLCENQGKEISKCRVWIRPVLVLGSVWKECESSGTERHFLAQSLGERCWSHTFTCCLCQSSLAHWALVELCWMPGTCSRTSKSLPLEYYWPPMFYLKATVGGKEWDLWEK